MAKLLPCERVHGMNVTSPTRPKKDATPHSASCPFDLSLCGTTMLSTLNPALCDARWSKCFKREYPRHVQAISLERTHYAWKRNSFRSFASWRFALSAFSFAWHKGALPLPRASEMAAQKPLFQICPDPSRSIRRTWNAWVCHVCPTIGGDPELPFSG